MTAACIARLQRMRLRHRVPWSAVCNSTACYSLASQRHWSSLSIEKHLLQKGPMLVRLLMRRRNEGVSEYAPRNTHAHGSGTYLCTARLSATLNRSLPMDDGNRPTGSPHDQSPGAHMKDAWTGADPSRLEFGDPKVELRVARRLRGRKY